MDEFPRQAARTRRFRLGVPRAFQLSPAGDRTVFLRSAGGRDPVGSLWVAEAVDGVVVERCVIDARTLLRDDAELPAAERARRERMRETTAGITATSVDDDLRHALVSLDGIPYLVALDEPEPTPIEVAAPGPVVDPRLSPDGRWAAYVHAGSVVVTPVDGSAEPRVLIEPDGDDDTWGLADFVAAEELDRSRGLWWLGSRHLLVEHVDESAVETAWIADPANPDRPPHPHRYPRAGTQNPTVALSVLGVDGSRRDLPWDRDEYCYLATVQVDDDGGATISVLSRDQRNQRILDLRPGATDLTVVADRIGEPWISMAGGVPARGPRGQLLEVVADEATDTFRLTVDGAPLTPPGLQVVALVDADERRLVLLAQRDPRDLAVIDIAWDGVITEPDGGPGYHVAAARGAGRVVARTSGEVAGSVVTAELAGARGIIENLAETPVSSPRPTYLTVGDRGLQCALLLPRDHETGAGLPVVLMPYGGPGHARVLHAAGAFAEDQWLADQGFAVLVVDGVGTPGRGPAWEHGIAGGVMARVLADQVAALEEVGADHPDLDLSRVGIMGWSFGGMLAAYAVLARPDVFAVAVAGAPVTDWALYDTAYTERYLGLPQDEPAAYAAESLLLRAAQLERPLMIIHGLADDNVLAMNSLRLSTSLLAAGRPHVFLPLSGVTHMTPQEDVAENLPRLQAAFLAEHLQR